MTPVPTVSAPVSPSGPSSRRRRRQLYAPRSCAACRARKAKCVWPENAAPPFLCKRCEHRGLECSFEQPDGYQSDEEFQRALRTHSRPRQTFTRGQPSSSSFLSAPSPLTTQTAHSSPSQNARGRSRALSVPVADSQAGPTPDAAALEPDSVRRVVERSLFYRLSHRQPQAQQPEVVSADSAGPNTAPHPAGGSWARFGQLLKSTAVSQLLQERRTAPWSGSHRRAIRASPPTSSVDALALWNPFLDLNLVKSSSFLSLVVSHLTAAEDLLPQISDEVARIMLIRSGDLAAAQSLLLLALYDPIDLAFPPVADSGLVKGAPGDTLIKTASMLLTSGAGATDVLASPCVSLATRLALWVASTLHALNQTEIVFDNDELDPWEVDVYLEACKTGRADKFGPHNVLAFRVQFYALVRRIWTWFTAQDWHDPAFLVLAKAKLEEGLAETEGLRSKFQLERECDLPIRKWLLCETNDILSSFAPRVSWMYFATVQGELPSASNVLNLLYSLPEETQVKFLDLNKVNRCNSLAINASLCFGGASELLSVAPSMLTLARAVSAAAGTVEVRTITKSYRQAEEADSLAGDAVWMRACAQGITQAAMGGQALIYRVAASVLETMAKITDEMSDCARDPAASPDADQQQAWEMPMEAYSLDDFLRLVAVDF